MTKDIETLVKAFKVCGVRDEAAAVRQLLELCRRAIQSGPGTPQWTAMQVILSSQLF